MSGLDKASIRTGVELVDQQHLKYFDLLISFLNRMAQKEDHSNLFSDFVDYVVYHFSTEEELMEKYHYDQTLQHKKQHAYFKDKVWEFGQVYANKEEMDVNKKMEISNFLFDWFVHHIRTVDKRLCNFILTQAKENASVSGMLNRLLHVFNSKHK